MPKELNLTPPLVEAQKMIAGFLCSVKHAELDLKRLAQLIEVGQQEIERGKILPTNTINDEHCSCENPTLGTNISRCGTCSKWFKRI